MSWVVGCVWALGCTAAHEGKAEPSGTIDEQHLRQFPTLVVERGERVLDCSDPAVPSTHVVFECDAATVYACEGVAGAVLEYEDGARERFTREVAQTETFASRWRNEGKRVTAIWVDLASGAGAERARQALGERFDAPQDSCRGFATGDEPEI